MVVNLKTETVDPSEAKYKEKDDKDEDEGLKQFFAKYNL